MGQSGTQRLFESLALIAGAVVFHVAIAEVPSNLIETSTSIAFGAPPTIGSPILSPDGRQLLFTQQSPSGVSILRTLDLQNGVISTLIQGTQDGYDISWCRFANESRIVCALTRGLYGPLHLRLVAFNSDGTDLQQMPREPSCVGFHHESNQPRIDLSHDEKQTILLPCGFETANIVDIYTRQVTDISGMGNVGQPFRLLPFGNRQQVVLIEPRPGSITPSQTLYSNGHGFANIYRGRQDNVDQWFFRSESNGSWMKLLETRPLELEPPFRPVGYGSSLDSVMHIGWSPETQTWGLFRRALTSSGENELLFAHETLDVELVMTAGKHQRIVSTAFLDENVRHAIIDPRVAEVYGFLADLFPDLNIEILDESWDQNRYLARARTANRSGDLLLIDMTNDSIRVIAPEYDHLTGIDLAETQLIQILDSNDRAISAHLTLPRDFEPPISAVIIPRSFPTHEDLSDPHYLVQYLAANGYAVMRVQNRVEQEFGTGWIPERAILGWRQSSEDILAAANYLVDQEISTADKICAAGKDYGAYTALMTAINFPGSLACVVGIGGVADPRATPGGELAAAMSGRSSDRSTEDSPIRRADEFQIPVLLFHGGADVDIAISEHSATLAKALERENKEITFIEYPNAGHQIRRAPERVDMLARIGAFLADNVRPENAN